MENKALKILSPNIPLPISSPKKQQTKSNPLYCKTKVKGKTAQERERER
jgi:hypothetical protein